jgi:hypothetical protein
MWVDWWRHYSIHVDGVAVGELWAKQVRLFEVGPGEHEIRAKLFPLMWSNKLVTTVLPGKIVELVCWPSWTGLVGPRSLHLATDVADHRKFPRADH